MNLSIYVVIAFIICIWTMVSPPKLHLSQFKDISKASLLPDTVMKFNKPSVYGPLQAISSPVFRYAPGLSLKADQPVGANTAVFLNGDWLGMVAGNYQTGQYFVLNYSSFDLPYSFGERKNVLVLKAGTGIEVAHALSQRATSIVAVEPNAVLNDALKHELASDNDSIFYQRAVKVQMREPRFFLMSDTSYYDLISLPDVGSFGGSSGLNAMQEQFLFTKEAFLQMWPHLTGNGAISITAWMDYPARNSLKLLATMVEVLEQLNVSNPREHIAAIRSWNTISFVMTKSSLTEQDIRRIEDFCDQWQFDLALLPGLKPEERTKFHLLQDSSLFLNMDMLFSTDRKDLYEAYDFNIVPPTDNKPYFSQFIRWKSLSRLAGYFGNRSIPFFEIGYLLVVITLVQITVTSIILVLLPLLRSGWNGKNKLGTLVYFGGIGLGYMFVEMVFIQYMIFYLGHPVYAAAAVISALLLFSGFGSYISGYFTGRRRALQLLFLMIIILLLFYAAMLQPLLRQTMQASLILKLPIVFILTAPLAFCMGIPFPAGLSQLARTQAKDIPWAWGVNGCISVISTAVATLIAVEAGFTMVLWLAGLAYFFPLIVCGRWK